MRCGASRRHLSRVPRRHHAGFFIGMRLRIASTTAREMDNPAKERHDLLSVSPTYNSLFIRAKQLKQQPTATPTPVFRPRRQIQQSARWPMSQTYSGAHAMTPRRWGACACATLRPIRTPPVQCGLSHGGRHPPPSTSSPSRHSMRCRCLMHSAFGSLRWNRCTWHQDRSRPCSVRAGRTSAPLAAACARRCRRN